MESLRSMSFLMPSLLRKRTTLPSETPASSAMSARVMLVMFCCWSRIKVATFLSDFVYSGQSAWMVWKMLFTAAPPLV